MDRFSHPPVPSPALPVSQLPPQPDPYARIEELETLCGMLYVALGAFAQPRQRIHYGAQIMYMVSEPEQERARRTRMYALQRMAETGTPVPPVPYSVSTLPLYGRRYTTPTLGPNSGPLAR